LRWELCKIWNCGVDDPKFGLINGAQWLWYAEMIMLDRKAKEERELDLLDYLASFWNHEAVENIRSARESEKEHNFATDQEFEKQLGQHAFRNDELLATVSNIGKHTNLTNNNDRESAQSRFRMPTDLTALKKAIEED
jgi:hypothetical protein